MNKKVLTQNIKNNEEAFGILDTMCQALGVKTDLFINQMSYLAHLEILKTDLKTPECQSLIKEEIKQMKTIGGC